MRIAVFVFMTLALVGCPRLAEQSQTPDASPPDPLAELEARYESFRRPLELNAWNKAVGEPTVDVQHHLQAKKDFFADSAIDTALKTLSTSDVPDIAVRADGWLRLRGNDQLMLDDAVQTANTALSAAIAGPKDDPLHGPQALMVLYGSPDAEARDQAQREVARRTAAMLPHLAARSTALNHAARAQGYSGYVHKHTGLPAQAAITQVEAQCSEAITRTEVGWKLLLERGAQELKRPPTDADWMALSTAWSGKAGSFLESEALPALAERALVQMGFDLAAMNIEIRLTPDRPGGAAYSISIPDDVRFRGFFPSGFEGARGWFHEVGHAVHMKEVRAERQPFRDLPHERALSEGIGEIFAAIVHDPNWLTDEFPTLSEGERQDYLNTTKAFDALAVRAYCYTTRLELSLYVQPPDLAALNAIHNESFGTLPKHGPAYNLYVYLKRPLYVWDYLTAYVVTKTFFERLGDQPLRSKAGGDMLRETLLAPGAQLTLKSYLSP